MTHTVDYIETKKLTPDLSDQLDFLIKCEFYIRYLKYKSLLTYITVGSILILSFSVLTNTNDFIIVKAVLLSLMTVAWVIILLFVIYFLYERFKRLDWKKKTIQSYSANNITFRFGFDTNQLYFITDTYKTELSWDYYKHYSFYKSSIFLFPDKNLYEALYYSKSELGDTQFDRLVSIASENLSLFEKKNGA